MLCLGLFALYRTNIVETKYSSTGEVQQEIYCFLMDEQMKMEVKPRECSWLTED